MPYCEAAEFFNEINDLLKRLSDGESLSRKQAQDLNSLLDRWDEVECPETGCIPDHCQYAKPLDWVEYHGYDCLYSLIYHLDQTKPITEIPDAGSIDPLDAPWARRPGHYNP